MTSVSSPPDLSPAALLARAQTALQAADGGARAWLVAHARPLRAAAEALRVAAVMTPGTDAELRAEAAAAAVALLAVYRDQAPVSSAPAAPTAVVALEALRAVELLFEMRARRRRAPRRGWTTIIVLEAVKAALRGALLLQRGGRMLTAEAEALPPVPDAPVCTCGMKEVPGAEKVLVTRGARSGRKILHLDPAHAPVGPASSVPADVLDPLFVTAYERRAAWLMRMFVPSGGCAACAPAANVAAAPASVRQQRQLAWPAPRAEHVAAEILYILRPLVHLALIRRYGWRSWRAWGASLAVDAASRQLMARSCDADVLEERQRRMLLMLLYLARSPLFDVAVHATLRKVERIVRRVPLLGPAAGSAVDLIRSIQRYWFYTSAT
jgi:peroxin-16